MSWQLFALFLALVLLGLAAAKTPEPTHVSYGWLGVFLVVLVYMLSGVRW